MSEPRQPNSFELSGDYGVELRYDATSITGEPQFQYRDGEREVSRCGDEVRLLEAEIGTLVTIELEAVPDLHVVDLSVLLPSINLSDGDEEFETLAIETTNRSNIGGPSMLTGALQTYRSQTLRGTARLLEF